MKHRACSLLLFVVTVLTAFAGTAPTATAPVPPTGPRPGGSAPQRPVLKNTCGNAGTTPQIFSSTVVSPPALDIGGNAPPSWNPFNRRLSRSGIEYVSVGALSGVQLELITDQCTFIGGVQFGSRVLSTAANYTYGYWYQVKDSPTQPSDRTRHGYDVWVFFPPQPDGSTDLVAITVRRTAGAGTATYSFPLVRVNTVEAINVDGAVGISRAELFNMFGKSLYAKFNGATNKAVTDKGYTIYDYDPSTMQVSVDPLGVSFGFRFKIDIPAWCDPTVYASGTFRLLTDPLKGFSVRWVNDAHGTLHWPFGCQVVQELIPGINLVIYTLIHEFIEGGVGSSVKSSIEDTVKKSLPEHNIFLSGSPTRNGELLVNLKLPVPSITIQVPYDTFDMNRSGTAFGSGEEVMLLASGLGMNDYVAQVTPQTTLWSGPNGVPRAGTTLSWPNQLTAWRSGTLVYNSMPVGQLLAQTSDSLLSPIGSTYHYTPGCKLKVPVVPQIRFGVNDTAADAQRLRGIGAAPGYTLRAFFVKDSILAPTPSCEGFSTRRPVIKQ